MEFYEIKINPDTYTEGIQENLNHLRVTLIKSLQEKKLEADASFETVLDDGAEKKAKEVTMYLESDYEAEKEIKEIWNEHGFPPILGMRDISKAEYDIHRE